MSQPTKATAAEIHGAASQHRTSAESFRQSKTQVESEVEGLKTTNRGDLMDKLDALQNEWSENVLKVTGLLDEMANYLDEVAVKIQGQDADSAGAVR